MEIWDLGFYNSCGIIRASRSAGNFHASRTSSVVLLAAAKMRVEPRRQTKTKKEIYLNGCHFHESVARDGCAFWSSHQKVAPAHEALHLHRTQRNPHYRSTTDSRRWKMRTRSCATTRRRAAHFCSSAPNAKHKKPWRKKPNAATNRTSPIVGWAAWSLIGAR